MPSATGSTSPRTERSPLLDRDADAASRDNTEEEDDEENDAETPQAGLPRVRAVTIVIFFAILIFLQSCNFSIMSTTSTTVAEDLEAYSSASWFTSAYMIAMSSLSPLSGRLSQIFDPRNCVLVSSLIFALGAVLAAHATSLATFLAGRAVQGAGAAGIYTLSVNLVIYLAPRKQRGIFIGGANSAITVGVSLGAVIGGEFITSIGWRPLFYLQAPVALVSAAILMWAIPSVQDLQSVSEQSIKEKLRSIDYLGSVLLIATLTSLLLGLSSTTGIWVLPILMSLVLLVCFVLTEYFLTASPVIPISVLSSRGVLLSSMTQLCFMTTRWSILFYSPIYVLAVRNWDPTLSGTILIPTNFGFAVGGLAVGWWHIRRGGAYYASTLACLGVFPLTVVLLAQLATREGSIAGYVGGAFVNGALAGAGLNYGLAHLLHLTSPSTHFVVTALLATARGFAGSFGAGIGGGLFARHLRHALETGFARIGHGNGTDEDTAALIERLLGSPALVGRLHGATREVAVDAYSQAVQALFYASAVLALGGVVLQAGTGWKGWKELERQEPWSLWLRRNINACLARKRAGNG